MRTGEYTVPEINRICTHILFARSLNGLTLPSPSYSTPSDLSIAANDAPQPSMGLDCIRHHHTETSSTLYPTASSDCRGAGLGLFVVPSSSRLPLSVRMWRRR